MRGGNVPRILVDHSTSLYTVKWWLLAYRVPRHFVRYFDAGALGGAAPSASASSAEPSCSGGGSRRRDDPADSDGDGGVGGGDGDGGGDSDSSDDGTGRRDCSSCVGAAHPACSVLIGANAGAARRTASSHIGTCGDAARAAALPGRSLSAEPPRLTSPAVAVEYDASLAQLLSPAALALALALVVSDDSHSHVEDHAELLSPPPRNGARRRATAPPTSTAGDEGATASSAAERRQWTMLV